MLAKAVGLSCLPAARRLACAAPALARLRLAATVGAGCSGSGSTSRRRPQHTLQHVPSGRQLHAAASATAEAATALEGGSASSSSMPHAPPPPEQPVAPEHKPIIMPTPVPPPRIPVDPSAWENGLVLVDKPQGWTSFDVCAKLRGALAALMGLRNLKMKVGHAGTLDPMATGLLLVCTGKGTKAVEKLMGMPKEYSGTMRLGEGTPSFDADTEVTEQLPWEHITDEQLEAARQRFLGPIQQLPPMYSALKVGGRKLVDQARKGRVLPREPRSITVDVFDLWRDAGEPQSVHFRVVASKGTYVRCLAADLGRALGSAAHLTALRRESVGAHRVCDAWRVEELVGQVGELRVARKAQQDAAQQAATQQEEEQQAAAEQQHEAAGQAG